MLSLREGSPQTDFTAVLGINFHWGHRVKFHRNRIQNKVKDIHRKSTDGFNF